MDYAPCYGPPKEERGRTQGVFPLGFAGKFKHAVVSGGLVMDTLNTIHFV
jgi:hypothetical protein